MWDLDGYGDGGREGEEGGEGGVVEVGAAHLHRAFQEAHGATMGDRRELPQPHS